jgi:hypothetical protein
MANGQCTIGARHEAEISALQKEAAERASEDQRQWTALGEARDRFEEALRLVSSRMPNGDCIVGAKHDVEIKNLQDRAAELHAVDQDQWTAINSIRNRLPTWATILIGVLMGLIGMLGAWARSRGG